MDKICDLLMQDFKRNDLRLGQGVDVTIKRLKADANIALAEAATSSMAERQIAASATRLANEEEKHLTLVVAQMSQSVAALKMANSELSNALLNDSPSIGELKMLSAEIQKLADLANTLSGKQ